MTDQAPGPAVSAGWYPAPGEAGLQRYWTGEEWGEARRPIAPVVQGSAASLVLGILGVLTAWFLVGIVFGIIAVNRGRKIGPTTSISRAGVILGWIAIALGLIFAIARGTAAAGILY